MYLAHFKLHEKPFQLNTDPRFLWLGQDHKEALATLRYGVLENKGLLLLTGEIGTGKTTLVSALVDQLGDESVVVAQLPDPGLTRREFFYLVSRKFGIDRPVHDKETFTDTFGEFLDDICTHNKKALLIIDEAQIMDSRVLEEVRLLSNMEYRHTKPLNIFLVGQTEFNQTLLKPENRALKERIAVNCNLKPLLEPETAAYIAYRLQVAGAQKRIFTDDAVREIQSFSKGSPRQINILCDLALVRGYAENAKILDSRMIEECEERILVHDASGGHFRGAIKASEDISRPEVLKVDAQNDVQPWTKPTRGIKRYGILALVILLPGLFIFFALWNSGLIKKVAPALDKTPPIHLQTTHDQAPGSMSTSPPKDLNDGRDLSGTNDTPASSPSRDLTPAVATPHPPSTPQPIIDTAKKAAVNLTIAPIPASDNRAGAIIVPQPPPIPVVPQKDKPTLSPPQREPDQEVETPVHMTETAGRHEDGHPVEKLPDLAKPSDPLPLALQEMGKDSVVAVDKPPVDRRKIDVARPATDPEGEKSALSRPSTESSDPANIIDWLLKEKIKADKLNKTPNLQPKPLLKTAAQSRGESDQIETKESSSDQIKRVATNTAAGQSTASPPNREEGIAASKKTTDDKVRVTEEKTPNNVPEGIRVIAEQPSEERTVEVRLEGRLRSFLQSYCVTYAANDLDKFTNFFSPDALENGQPFESLLPKYQKSFNVTEAIQYRIELQQYTHDNQKGTVDIQGNFLLRWLPPDKKWRENSGKIFMNLKDDGSSFLVQKLDYYGSRSTN
ncbi:MAG: AAA family ATPase [Desulfobacterales bacterium]|nr:AAA family ATPase [Desulfobacterales bacterium]